MNALEQTRASLLARLSSAVDRGVWLEFFDRYGELILDVARRRGLQDSDCDDVVQDVIAALIPAMKSFRYDPARGRFRGYLRTVTENAIRKVYRRRQGRSLEELGHEPEDASSADDVWEREWRRYHVRRALRAVEGELPERERTAFTWYVIQGMPAAEVAEGLGMSVDQVYQARSRVLKRLSAFIDAQKREEG